MFIPDIVTDLREAARFYLAQGHPVVFSKLSFDENGKKTSSFTTKWKGDSVCDSLEKLERINVSKYNAIGVRCDNLLVLDFDYHHTLVPDIISEIGCEDLLYSHCQFTSKGRVHFIFNRSDRIARKYNLRQYCEYDIDIQTSETSVLWCAPTLGFNDTRYMFMTGPESLCDIPPAFCDWLDGLLELDAIKKKVNNLKPVRTGIPKSFNPANNDGYIKAIKDRMEQ